MVLGGIRIAAAGRHIRTCNKLVTQKSHIRAKARTASADIDSFTKGAHQMRNCSERPWWPASPATADSRWYRWRWCRGRLGRAPRYHARGSQREPQVRCKSTHDRKTCAYFGFRISRTRQRRVSELSSCRHSHGHGAENSGGGGGVGRAVPKQQPFKNSDGLP